jgi:hypothetical protein
MGSQKNLNFCGRKSTTRCVTIIIIILNCKWVLAAGRGTATTQQTNTTKQQNKEIHILHKISHQLKQNTAHKGTQSIKNTPFLA